MIMARKKREIAPENHDRWMVSYADFVTLLFAFFVSLYALSTVNEGKYKKLSESLSSAFSTVPTPAIDRAEEFPRIVERFNSVFSPDYRRVLETLQVLDDSPGLTLLYDKDSVTIRMLDAELFVPALDRFTPEAAAVLDEVAAVLNSITQNIRVEAHTDNIPVETESFPSNWDLSSARALKVLKYFINNNGLAPGRFSAVGYGEFSPIATNNSPAGRAKNSRVDILVLTPQ